MTFLHYQLIIFVSVLCLTRLHRRLGAGSALVWTLWSIATLAGLPFMAVQTFTAWISWYGTRCFLKQKTRAGNAPQTADHKAAPNANRTTAKSSLIQGRDHHNELTHALQTARKELMIVSGWLSDRVVNDQFCGLLASALNRGVNVHIAYGASDRDRQHRLSETAIKALERLKEIGDRSRKGRLTIVQRPTHKKCLIVDKRYAIVGSFNWLANAHYRDRETSLRTRQRRVVVELMTSCREGVTRSTEVYGVG
ncbi:phospholipase D-like domain-containing protein [Kushneria indalinina]|uniref:phospholipase D n=1 Tax=Kushneria indalinina DSM 14324 TaxID=1122140 RepID=A0A3D9DVS2_9GAMM|nr:phospholipase D-like domain-containing protein [Kushneria indalinina]REC94862.1 phospholipase D-like protein [Kushneria indalinina DSM 14324]